MNLNDFKLSRRALLRASSTSLAVGCIRGMQQTGTVACIKHFSANNQEMHRFTVDVQAWERALREIYLLEATQSTKS